MIKRDTLERITVAALVAAWLLLCGRGMMLANRVTERHCTTDTDCMMKYGGDGGPQSKEQAR